MSSSGVMNLNKSVKNTVSSSAAESDEVNNVMKKNPCSSASSSSSSSAAASPFLIGTNNNFDSNEKMPGEFWGEIVNEECGDNINKAVLVNSNKRKLINGGTTITTTLEQFLARSDYPKYIANPQPLSMIDPMMLENHQQQAADWMGFQMDQQQQQQQQTRSKRNLSDAGVEHDSVYRVSDIGQVFDTGGYPLNNGLVEFTNHLQKMEVTQSESHSGGERKRHYQDEIMERNMERRQKRMIKNRESAARSRAKKQAYTKQLENDVEQLKKQNNWLRRIKDFQVSLFSNSLSEPKYQLRRTSSAGL